MSRNIQRLQREASNIRNICILAHVDHGKTTLADSLVASNGIISQRLSGKLRYMDSREDEQIRGITMKSSAISLHYQQNEQDYLINLIDSPGHIDFSSEVSTAVRLCDGAIVLVDVVEGVCPQTHAVLRQAWLENIQPILVLNKIDRLILEWKMSPLEAYTHLQRVLEQVNAITGELFTSSLLGKESAKTTEANIGHSETNTGNSNQSSEQVYEWVSALEDTDDSHLYFSPDQGNVVFASAIDGWGFSINQFAELYSSKLGIRVDLLRKTLWGDYFLNVKQRRIMKGAHAKGKKPLFVQFVLENLWAVYESICVNRDKDKLAKILDALSLKIPQRDARHSDSRVQLQAVCCQWLPLSKAILRAVCDKLPSPLEISEERVENLMCGGHTIKLDSWPDQTKALKEAFLACSPSADQPVIVFVSKMFPVDKRVLPQNKQRPLTQEELVSRRRIARQRHQERIEEKNDREQPGNDVTAGNCSQPDCTPLEGKVDSLALEQDYVFVAFGRVFSGTVKKGQKLHVLGPKHDPSEALRQVSQGMQIKDRMTLEDLTSCEHITTFTVNDLYLFMGREMESLDEVPAGNVLGIGGLEEHVLKSATLSNTIACPAFTDMYFEASPIVRVALEPKNSGDVPKLVRGMRLLNQADPCVEVLVQETGEHVIIAAGEVHLQRCVDDLRERYAKIGISVSPPIVPFRETIIPPPKMDMLNEAIHSQSVKNKKVSTADEEKDNDVIGLGLVEMDTPNKDYKIRVRALPLPDGVTKLLESNSLLLKTLEQFTSNKDSTDDCTAAMLPPDVTAKLNALRTDLQAGLKAEKRFKYWRKVSVDDIWAFGPRRNGPNILVNGVPSYSRPSVWNYTTEENQSCPGTSRDYDSSVISGFQLATLAGPLCEEPLMGVGFVVEKWETTQSTCQDLSESIRQNLTETVSRQHTVSQSSEDSLPGEMTSQKTLTYGPMSGQIMSTVKECCRKSFQSQPQRLMAAMYGCTIQATSDVLGKMYAVLSKRRGRVLEEDMKEGSQIFNVTATLPVVESFGFAEDIRKKTSGLASPQLKFSHWEVIDLDPFWEPTTEEEYLHYGEKADSVNQARKYMNSVRRRKGLKVDEQIVEYGEKQRTLGKNK